MVIKASNTLIFINNFVIDFCFFILVLLLCVVVGLKISLIEIILFSILLSAIDSVYSLFFVNNNIEFSCGQCIGGRTLEKGLFVKRQQFVFSENVNINKSIKRSFYERVIGQYEIYNLDGSGFKFNKNYFSKNKLEVIKEKLKIILDIEFE